MTQTSIDGGCQCGAIRYRVEGPGAESMICHCRTCRRVSGAPVVPWVTFPLTRYRVLTGVPIEFSSSPQVRRTFCGACGTPLTFRHERDRESIDVTTCSLDDPEAFPPQYHSWLSHDLSWVRFGDDLPRFPERSGHHE